jgi:DNA-binding response OmpR family regulator
LFHVGRTCPDLIILRVDLATVPAATVVSIVRSADNVPIVLSAGDGETDLLGPALLAGASEVMERPYRKREVAALLARHLPDAQARRLEAAHLDFGPLRLDGPAMTVRLNERLLPITMREFELLRLLVVNADRVVSYDEIRRQVWEVRGESVTPRTIAVHATRLRKQLAGVIDVVGVRGLGYRLERPPR